MWKIQIVIHVVLQRSIQIFLNIWYPDLDTSRPFGNSSRFIAAATRFKEWPFFIEIFVYVGFEKKFMLNQIIFSQNRYFFSYFQIFKTVQKTILYFLFTKFEFTEASWDSIEAFFLNFMDVLKLFCRVQIPFFEEKCPDGPFFYPGRSLRV